ncbi:MAG: ATP-binding protein [Actinomycetota bacterium]
MAAVRGFPTGVTLARALAVGRWLTWAWMVAVVAVAGFRTVDDDAIRPDDPSGAETALRSPAIAWLAVVAVLAVAIWATTRLRTAPARALSPGFAGTEMALALALSVLDGLVFDPGHVFATSQSLATQYPAIAVASIGLAAGPRIAAAAGVLVGPAEWWAATLNDFDDWSLRHTFSIVATSLFFAALGALIGWLGGLLRDLELRIADQRARDEVAGVLHDTVLQTLALVEQRSIESDPDLAAAARRADRDLRSYLFGSGALTAEPDRSDDLETRLRRVVDDVRRRIDLEGSSRVTVNVIDVGVGADRRAVDAVVDAAGEALTNSLTHADATRIVVFAETDDDGEVTVTVRDDGRGFDPDSTARSGRRGLRHSIVERVETAGGSVRLRSSTDGTEVLLTTRAPMSDEVDTR